MHRVALLTVALAAPAGASMSRVQRQIAIISSAIVAVAVVVATAQAPQFEVASVKPNLLDDHIVTVRVGPGPTFTARGYTLVLLIQRAYGVMDWNVTGGPAWIRAERWDVTAKADIAGDLKEAALQPRLTKLLADRFKLRVHESTQDTDAYALEIARGGPKLTPSPVQQEERDTFRFTATDLEGHGISMADFARFVAGKLGLVAVDLTGLKGFYDMKAEWRLTPAQADLAGDDAREAMRAAVIATLESQLGLKLSAKRVPVRTLVIDSVERASDN
jgi:uncharacterized protein (TIGR03435 family)